MSLGPLRLTVHGILEGVSFALRAATLAFMAATLLLTTDALVAEVPEEKPAAAAGAASSGSVPMIAGTSSGDGR